MKFGVLQFFSWPGRRFALQEVYERALQRIDVMDQTGYDAVWLAEHHFNDFSVCPSVHVMAANVAARTKRLRIGTGVTLAALYQPLRIAEEIALIDHLSGGRVNWGAGRGFDATEFRAFGVTMEESGERFHEAVDVVLASWRNEKLEHHGKYFHYEDLEVLPKPLQQPHPPVWLAASSPPSVEWAARHGFTIMMDPHSPHREIARKRALYQEVLEANGHSMHGREIPMARLLAVANTEQEAFEVARKGAGWTVEAYIGGLGHVFDESAKDVDPVERYMKDVVVYGTPESVVDQLQQLEEEIPLDYLLCSTLSHETFELMTERVIPKLL
ncbi:MAG: LLM class flavin-dependent oxidoreductase [Myxococcota bacterium]